MIAQRVYDIAFHGSSLTSLRVSIWQDTFRGRMLAERNKAVRSYDLGQSGATSLYILLNMGPGLDVKPWAAVIEAGANDQIPEVGISVAQFKANLSAMLEQYRSTSPATKLFLMTMNPFITPPVNPIWTARLPDYYQAMRDLAAETPDVSLIDVWPDWGSPTTSQIPDGVHPNAAAQNDVIVPKLMAVFDPLMV